MTCTSYSLPDRRAPAAVRAALAWVSRALHDDPPALTRHLPDGEEKLAVYRRVRDDIRRFIETLPASFKTSQTHH